MTELPISLPAHDGTVAENLSRHRLDQLDGGRVAKHLILFRPTEEAVADLMEKARLSIPGLAATEDVLNVFRYNPDCMSAVSRKSKFNPDRPVGEAFIAMLPLTKLGLQLLAVNALNTAKPDTRFLVRPGERPAGIYIWGLFTPGPLVGGVALFMEKMASPEYAGINFYSRPNTEAGERFNASVGLTKGTQIGSIEAPHLWVFQRAPRVPLYDSYTGEVEGREVSVTIARNLEDLARVMAIRSAVYIGEQECPYEEEFDGNDLAATHLMAFVGNEPVGCLRVRYFADFAKIERLAVREEFRKTRAAFQLVRAGFRLCQKKGYTRVYGHSQKRLVDFWARFGFRVMEGGKSFVFSDFDYVEIIADIERDPDCITIGTDPYVIIRPEGRWHQPGILEYSAVRPATSPSVTSQSVTRPSSTPIARPSVVRPSVSSPSLGEPN
jgi:predicted GNAT family N-acyltransferase